jgi:hypothetical protein
MWLNNTPLYLFTTLFLKISSIYGHLGGLNSLAVVNSAAMNMGVQVALLYAGLHTFLQMCAQE